MSGPLVDTQVESDDSIAPLPVPAAPASTEPAEKPAPRALALFIATVAIASGFLVYFTIRFLVTADGPELHMSLRGAHSDAFAAMSVFDGPLLSLVRIVVVATTFILTAVFVAARHPSDTMVLLIATNSVFAGLYSASIAVLTSTETFAIGRGLAAFVYMLLPAGALMMAAVFPTGRPVPRWALAAVPVALVPFVVQAVYMYEYRKFSVSIATGTLLIGVLFLGFQVHRYRRHATLRERVQIKWLNYAGAVFVGLQLVAVGLVMPLLQDPTRPGFPLFRLLFELLLGGSYLVGMACMLASAARFRLWDIDRVINRTVVYGVVTLLLLATCAVAYFTIAPISSVIAIAISIALFPLARRRISRWIDRRFYGIGIDYEGIAAKALRAVQVPTTSSELGAYNELVLLGRGGMGAVYRAHHADFKMPIALKVMSPELARSPGAHARFQREAEILETIDHPNVVPFLASGHDHGLAFIAMQYVEGEDLATTLRKHDRLSLEDVVPVIEGVAAALDAAHALGVVHRDVKPGNVLLEGDDRQRVATRRPFLMDFGVALVADDSKRAGDESLVGSLPYISPEQIQHTDQVDGRADIYSLGATAYELLSGHAPFRESSALALVMAHLRQPPVDPRVHVPDLPDSAAAALLTALSKSPNERFTTAGAFAAALRAALPAR